MGSEMCIRDSSRRLPVLQVVFDTKIFPRSSRIVRGCQNNSSQALGRSTDSSTDGWGSHDPTTCGQPNVRYTIRREHATNDGHGFGVVITAVSGYYNSVDKQRGWRVSGWAMLWHRAATYVLGGVPPFFTMAVSIRAWIKFCR